MSSWVKKKSFEKHFSKIVLLWQLLFLVKMFWHAIWVFCFGPFVGVYHLYSPELTYFCSSTEHPSCRSSVLAPIICCQNVVFSCYLSTCFHNLFCSSFGVSSVLSWIKWFWSAVLTCCGWKFALLDHIFLFLGNYLKFMSANRKRMYQISNCKYVWRARWEHKIKLKAKVKLLSLSFHLVN